MHVVKKGHENYDCCWSIKWSGVIVCLFYCQWSTVELCQYSLLWFVGPKVVIVLLYVA